MSNGNNISCKWQEKTALVVAVQFDVERFGGPLSLCNLVYDLLNLVYNLLLLLLGYARGPVINVAGTEVKSAYVS